MELGGLTRSSRKSRYQISQWGRNTPVLSTSKPTMCRGGGGFRGLHISNMCRRVPSRDWEWEDGTAGPIVRRDDFPTLQW
jgi:hypothetical protein